MGKGILILAMGMLVLGLISLGNTQQSSRSTDARVSNHQAEIVAREIARSALNQKAAEVRRSFAAVVDGALAGQPAQGGTYDITTERLGGGAVRVMATGHYGGVQHTISQTLTLELPFEATLLIDAELDGTKIVGNYHITGNDTPPPSAVLPANSLYDVNAIRAATSATSTLLREEIRKGGRADGVGGQQDIVQGDFTLDYVALYEEAMDHPDAQVIGASTSNRTFGSPSAPVVVIANTSTSLSNVTGYGILVVNGTLSLDKSRWEGLVIVSTDQFRLSMGTQTSIYGSMILIEDQSEAPPTPPECKGKKKNCKPSGPAKHGDIEFHGTTNLYYSAEALLRLRTLLPTIREASIVKIAEHFTL